MPGPFVHRIDPIIAEVGDVYLWWYGLSYTLGLLGVHLPSDWTQDIPARYGERHPGLRHSLLYPPVDDH